MSYEYEENLPAEALKRYKDKLDLLGLEKCPYKYPADQWVDDPTVWPPLGYHHLYHYLIKTPRIYSPEAMENYKSLEAFKYFKDGWVQTIYVIKVSGGLLMKSDVRPSYRTTDVPHKPWVVIGLRGNVLGGHCSCMAGLGETCSHVAAVLYKIETAVRIGMTKVTPTDLPCQWNQAFTKAVGGSPVSEINLYTKEAKCKLTKPKKHFDVHIPEESFHRFLDSVNEVAPKTVGLHLFKNYQPNFVFKEAESPQNVLIPSLRSFYSSENIDHASEDFDALVSQKVKTITCTEEQVQYIEEATRNQSASAAWYEQRIGRITGSSFFDVSHSSIEKPSKSLLSRLCQSNKQNLNVPALQWGREHEAEAIALYENVYGDPNFITSLKSVTDTYVHEQLEVDNLGLCVSVEKPWYAASPDALVLCACCGYRVLEVKCPYSLRYKSLKEEIQKGDFYVYSLGNDKFALRTNHKYYYQVQLEMYCTLTNSCDFFVWTPQEFIAVTVIKDKEFIDRHMNFCDDFWHKCIIKELLTRSIEKKKQSLGNAEATTSTSRKYCIENCVSNNPNMVGCDKCDNWYHAECLKYKKLPTTKTWYCHECRKTKKEKQ